jgi:hypothetical protein
MKSSNDLGGANIFKPDSHRKLLPVLPFSPLVLHSLFSPTHPSFGRKITCDNIISALIHIPLTGTLVSVDSTKFSVQLRKATLRNSHTSDAISNSCLENKQKSNPVANNRSDRLSTRIVEASNAQSLFIWWTHDRDTPAASHGLVVRLPRLHIRDVRYSTTADITFLERSSSLRKNRLIAPHYPSVSASVLHNMSTKPSIFSKIWCEHCSILRRHMSVAMFMSSFPGNKAPRNYETQLNSANQVTSQQWTTELWIVQMNTAFGSPRWCSG